MITLLTLLALKEEVVCVIPVDEIVEDSARNFKLNVKKVKDINNKKFVNYLFSLKPDLFVCCHGRQILKKEILAIGCINLHPCLYAYKGARPIKRLLEEKNPKASVGLHHMTQDVDRGEVILENFVDVSGLRTEEEVYNKLYLYYVITLAEGLKKIKKKNEIS